ncbi:glycosyltransferase family 4 protein [Naasia lichenicola]|uniref:Glycosyltransferase family 4 protein n=1 Tax=Naasia lichenicola TaxID=2565933 RepID=A0A4S4FR79_9MICO|nr:glycosyltransferase family 1 protein [Naasia lichenicola]THG33133.1 glycosyltransferase family 4 protein [Naasia lichenicola]
MKLVVDCRYIRTDGRHDGISRYSNGIVTALARRAARSPDVELTMLISSKKQLELLPDLPWAMASAPTSPREPLVALQVNRLEPDVVFTPMQTMGKLGRRYRLVVTLHDLIYYRHRTPPREFAWWVRLLWRIYYLAWWPQRLLLNGADSVVTVSKTTKRLMAQHRLTRRRVDVVYNASDDPVGERLALASARTPPAPASSEPRILIYMGSFIGYKNVEALVRAMAFLPDHELHLMSRITPDELHRLERIAPGARLRFHNGATDEQYADALLSATALVSSSLDEGFGIPVIEAMRLGTPVVISDIEIFEEIGGDAAILVDPHDPAAIAQAIGTLDDPTEWAARSAASVRQAELFSWDASAAVLWDVLVQLGERPKR